MYFPYRPRNISSASHRPSSQFFSLQFLHSFRVSITNKGKDGISTQINKPDGECCNFTCVGGLPSCGSNFDINNFAPFSSPKKPKTDSHTHTLPGQTSFLLIRSAGGCLSVIEMTFGPSSPEAELQLLLLRLFSKLVSRLRQSRTTFP